MKQDIAAIKEKIDKLNETIEYHKDAYYVQSAPVISDKEYDNLVDELAGLVETYNALVSEKEQLSPYESVGAKSPSNKFKHPFPMLSLEKIKFEDTAEFEYEEFESVLDWFTKRTKRLGDVEMPEEVENIYKNKEKIDIMVMPKFDGIALELIYHNGLLTHASTRGDGLYGTELDIERIKQIKSIPSDIRQYFKQGMVVVRGEVLFARKDFERLYPDKKIGISRNVASGVVMSSSDENIKELTFFIFQMNVFDEEGEEIPYNPSFFKHVHLFNGGETVSSCDTSNESFFYAVASVANKTIEDTNYKKDGIVVKIDDYYFCKALGETAHHPRCAVAIKMLAESGETEVKDIAYGISNTGVIVPYLVVEPIELNGSLTNSVSMFNLRYLMNTGLKIGDTVLIRRAGDVIPQYVRTVKACEGTASYISKCPFCDTELNYDFKQEGFVDQKLPHCSNVSCKGTNLVKIMRWFDLDGLGKTGIDKETIKKLREEHQIYNIIDLLKYEPEEGGVLNKKQIEGLNKLKTHMKEKLNVVDVLVALGCHPTSIKVFHLDKLSGLEDLFDESVLQKHIELNAHPKFKGETGLEMLKKTLNDYVEEPRGKEVVMGLIELGICTR